MRRKTKRIVISLLILAITSAVLFTFSFFNAKVHTVVISVGGKPYATLRLKRKILTINGTNTLAISSKGVRMLGSTCKDKACMAQGEISAPLMSLTCAQNKVFIQLQARRSQWDAISQ